jgi:hypothetical protein
LVLSLFVLSLLIPLGRSLSVALLTPLLTPPLVGRISTPPPTPPFLPFLLKSSLETTVSRPCLSLGTRKAETPPVVPKLGES